MRALDPGQIRAHILDPPTSAAVALTPSKTYRSHTSCWDLIIKRLFISVRPKTYNQHVLNYKFILGHKCLCLYEILMQFIKKIQLVNGGYMY